MKIVRYDKHFSYHQEFKQLNVDWINTYFVIEPTDIQVLDDPQHMIFDFGGSVFMALEDTTAIGCCALLVHDKDTCELAKMAVSPDSRNRGVGFQLGCALFDRALKQGFRRVVLEANTQMKASVALYHKLGFHAVDKDCWPEAGLHTRCNLYMEKLL